jgi:hypothetical protein
MVYRLYISILPELHRLHSKVFMKNDPGTMENTYVLTVHGYFRFPNSLIKLAKATSVLFRPVQEQDVSQGYIYLGT